MRPATCANKYAENVFWMYSDGRPVLKLRIIQTGRRTPSSCIAAKISIESNFDFNRRRQRPTSIIIMVILILTVKRRGYCSCLCWYGNKR